MQRFILKKRPIVLEQVQQAIRGGPESLAAADECPRVNQLQQGERKVKQERDGEGEWLGVTAPAADYITTTDKRFSIAGCS